MTDLRKIVIDERKIEADGAMTLVQARAVAGIRVRGFLNSPPEGKPVRAAVAGPLAENGVVEGREATYCSLGRAGIQGGSSIGQLL